MANDFPHLVFVYGTLKRNEPNHENYMKNPNRGANSWIGVGELVGRLPLIVASRHNVRKFKLYQNTQCGNYRIFLSLRFCVKSISEVLEVQNLPF